MQEKQTNRLKLFFIDPMSYHGLALYDQNIIQHFKDIEVSFFGSSRYTGKLPIIKLYSYSDRPRLLKAFSYLCSQIRLLMCAIDERPAVAHFQWLKLPLLDLFLIYLFRILGIKVVLTAHNVVPHSSQEKSSWILQKVYSAVDVIIVHNHYSMQTLDRLFSLSNDSVKIIPHGIFDYNHLNATLCEQAAQPLVSRSSQFDLTIGFLGELRPNKGIDVFLAFLETFASTHPSILFVIAGGGNPAKKTVVREFENVYWQESPISDELFAGILRTCKYVLLPYLSISQSGLILTCIGEKIPVIVSPLPPFKEIFDIEPMGLLLDTVTSEGIEACVQDLSTFSTESINWELLQNQFDWKKIAANHEAIYLELASQITVRANE